MVIIQPSGGLCNRMRVINSSLELAKRKGCKLLVLWYCADELNAQIQKYAIDWDVSRISRLTR